MNTLHVEPATTETSPGEFVTDGFRIVPIVDGQRGEPVYQSRFANKATTKAIVLLGLEKFEGWGVTVSGTDVTDPAGKLNLSMLADAQRFQAIRGLAMADLDADGAVEAMKAHDAETTG